MPWPRKKHRRKIIIGKPFPSIHHAQKDLININTLPGSVQQRFYHKTLYRKNLDGQEPLTGIELEKAVERARKNYLAEISIKKKNSLAQRFYKRITPINKYTIAKEAKSIKS